MRNGGSLMKMMLCGSESGVVWKGWLREIGEGVEEEREMDKGGFGNG